MDAPYSKYCSSYLTGFDKWEPVQSNQRLSPILENFSASMQPPSGAIWTLDALLSLPHNRLKYYLELYGRLLKSSAPGKSTDLKLIEGVKKLEDLLAIIDDRYKIALPGPTHVLETTDEVVIDTREMPENVKKTNLEHIAHSRTGGENTLLQPDERNVRASFESSARASSISSG